MENAGIRITAEVVREDGSRAQLTEFVQNGLTALQLLEVQEQAVLPCAAALLKITAGWGAAAKEKAAAVSKPMGNPNKP